MVISFKDWQNSKTYTSLSDFTDDYISGYLYACNAYIEDTRTWSYLASHRWYLLLDRDEYLSDDLEELERKLYDWLVDEELIRSSKSYLEGDELLTKREVIDEIMDRVQNQLWSSKDECIVEFARTVGIDIVASTNGLFWKKITEKTDESV